MLSVTTLAIHNQSNNNNKASTLTYSPPDSKISHSAKDEDEYDIVSQDLDQSLILSYNEVNRHCSSDVMILTTTMTTNELYRIKSEAETALEEIRRKRRGNAVRNAHLRIESMEKDSKLRKKAISDENAKVDLITL